MYVYVCIMNKWDFWSSGKLCGRGQSISLHESVSHRCVSVSHVNRGERPILVDLNYICTVCKSPYETNKLTRKHPFLVFDRTYWFHPLTFPCG